MIHQGTLYIIATPIGNLKDITLRAIDVLKQVDIIACEDTRITSILLNKYDIKKPLLAINEFNEEQVIYQIINTLKTQNVALVSDAGTPLISDPGYRLVKEAKKQGFNVSPIPGPSAAIAALSVSSQPTDKFAFLGFLSKSTNKNKKQLAQYQNLETTIILYESPHRITKTLETIHEIFGDIPLTIARELTKIHEEVVVKKVSEFEEIYNAKTPKGELVVLFSTKN